MEISKMLTLSTAHITEETAKFLEKEADDNRAGLCVYNKGNYGFFVYIIPTAQGLLPEKYYNLPQDLLKCIVLAHESGCKVLCLDCCGEETILLDRYDW